MGHAPENTIASLEKAIALGCDQVETDVWLVGSRLAIAHDAEDAPTAALSLDTVLDVCRGRVVVTVEMKCAGTEAAARETGRAVAKHLAVRGAEPVSYTHLTLPTICSV